MATPRVFISSTCYDLKYIRENLKYFIRTIGYDPIMSEEGSIFYNPKQHTQDACLSEVPNCQIFVLIIGGRYGTVLEGKDKSITNAEYKEAVGKKIPVFAIVEQGTYNDYFLYKENIKNDFIDENKITYPSADSTAIFEFIDEVRSNSINNAIVGFRDFSDIETYLKQQWAGMMFGFLLRESEEQRVADIMEHLLRINERVEYLSTQILKSVGSDETKALAALYEVCIQSGAFRTLLDTGHHPDPLTLLKANTLSDAANVLGKPFIVIEDKSKRNTITSSTGEINPNHLIQQEIEFSLLKIDMNEILMKYGFTREEFLETVNQTKKNSCEKFGAKPDFPAL